MYPNLRWQNQIQSDLLLVLSGRREWVQTVHCKDISTMWWRYLLLQCRPTAENAVDCRKSLSVSIPPPPLVSGRTSGIALQQHSSQKISFLFVSLKKVLSWFYSCFCSRSQILLVHMCFGIRISSPFHPATQTIPIQNQNCATNAHL